MTEPETVAIILNRKLGLAVGQMVLIMNLVIYSVAGILFGPDRAMYSLLTYFITSKVLDVVENGVKTKPKQLLSSPTMPKKYPTRYIKISEEQ